ncbi:hypothetical protein ACQEVY_33520 [Streptomyces sp. CA-288835]|uniref:hypothetical protein n=1 Tax=Streptomyces sp. CA-288835 TaxID=3240069 RepID=UPI003D8B5C83
MEPESEPMEPEPEPKAPGSTPETPDPFSRSTSYSTASRSTYGRMRSGSKSSAAAASA